MSVSPSAIQPPVLPPSNEAAASRDDLRSVAQDLEASFLAEMLKHAGFGAARSTFGGGAGEKQFASLLRMEHARALAASGGIGLAESLFQTLVDQQTRETGADG